MNVLPPHAVVDWLLSPSNLITTVVVVLGLAIALLAVRGFVRTRRGEAASGGSSRSGTSKILAIAGNWQLLLLGTTAFLLSVASGYRVWEGMSNFTNEKYLSLMITFGMQGIMLIVAWLIGESFANGMSRRTPEARRAGVIDALIGIVLAIIVVSVVFYWLLYATGTFGINKSGFTGAFDWARFADISVYFAIGLIVIAVLAFNFARGGELALPYVQSLRIIVKNAMLWVMLLACMASAVFFSFDSLFASIFPREERARAAQLRAQNQVAGMVADIGTTIESRRVAEVGNLFGSKDSGWARYDDHLTKLSQNSQGAQREIEAYFNSQLEERNRAIKQQQERITSAQSGSAGLLAKKATLTDELSRLKGERPGLAADQTEKKSELDNRAKGIDAKRVEAQAESRGAEGTLKQGQGPVYRQLMAELARLQDAYKIQEGRVRDASQRLNTTDTRIAQLERELAAVDGDIAKLKGEAETAQQRIKLTQETSTDDNQPRMDPTRVLPAFERARLEFRQEPTKEKLGALQQQCSQLYNAMVSTPATKDRVRSVDCDPKQAVEAAAVMFALNDGLKAFEATCSGGDRLEALKTTDALYSFARKCLADSGLPAKETDDLRGKINYLELTRDDKAHPFVASLNAFQDGNRLAYLSLGIAIIMESLVFMAGLFGATAIRSPLSDVPTTKARSGKEMERLIETALGEEHERYDNARTLFQRLRPSADPTYSMEISLANLGPTEIDVVLPVLSAGREIGAVEPHRHQPDTFLVRGELFAFIAQIANRKVIHNTESAREHELKKIVLSSLQPHVGDHADIMLHHCRPISERNGFSAEIYLSKMPADDAFVVQKVLNAGATLSYVQLDERPDEDQRYYVHKQLYKTLLLISSAAPRTGQRSMAPQLAPPSHSVAQGGRLETQRPALGQPQARPALQNLMKHPAPPQAAPSRDEPHRGSSTYSSLRDEYMTAMIASLGVAFDSYVSIGGDTYGAAMAAIDAFKTVQRSNRMLDRLIQDREQQAQFLLDQAYENLTVSAGAHGKAGRDALESAYNEVLGNLSIISILPGGPIERELKSLRRELETQFESDTARPKPEEEDLLRLVRRLDDTIAGSKRERPEEWQQLQLGFAQDQGPFALFANRGQRRPGSR